MSCLKWSHRIVFGVALAAACLVLPTLVQAAPATLSATVNVRGGPGAGYPRLTTFPAWTRVDAGPCRYGWCRIRLAGGYDGWVSGRYVNFGYDGPRSNTTIVLGGGWGPELGPYWGPYWGSGWNGGPYYNGGCGWRCRPHGPRHGWNPHRRGPNWGDGWNPRWGVGPVIPRRGDGPHRSGFPNWRGHHGGR